MRAALGLVIAIGACNPDSQAIDALPAQASLTITGHVTAAGAAVEGAIVGAYRNSSGEPVAMTASDAQGNYVLPVATDGKPLDYVGATLTAHVPTHVYLPQPIIADVVANVDLATSEELKALAMSACNTTLTLTVEVPLPTADAVVSTVPVPNRYCTANGTTYLLGLTGPVTISATQSGFVLGSRTVDALFNTLTVAIVR